MSQSDLDSAIEGYRQALKVYVTGDPEPVTEFFSRRDDVTLANPLGPPRVGPEDAWKVVHRHADPITTARPITTVIET